jgi:hypothetical protein
MVSHLHVSTIIRCLGKLLSLPTLMMRPGACLSGLLPQSSSSVASLPSDSCVSQGCSSATITARTHVDLSARLV